MKLHTRKEIVEMVAEMRGIPPSSANTQLVVWLHGRKANNGKKTYKIEPKLEEKEHYVYLHARSIAFTKKGKDLIADLCL